MIWTPTCGLSPKKTIIAIEIPSTYLDIRIVRWPTILLAIDFKSQYKM
jgi:hypothetical protein